MGATFVMSYPAADWRVVAGQNRRSAAAKGAPSNPRRALTEWLSLADAILYAGGRIIVVDPPANAPPSLVYTADWGALIRRNDQPLFLTAKGVGHRAAEAHVRAFLESAGVPMAPLEHVWGGRGDLIQVAPGRFIFLAGARTDANAGALVAKELGTTVRYIEAKVAAPFEFGDEVAAQLHTTAGDRILIVHEPGLAGRSIPELRTSFNPVEVVSIDAEDADLGACTALDVNGTTILPAGLSTTLRGTLLRRGLRLVELELPELLGRGGGGPHALVNELVGFVIGDGAPDYTRNRERIVALVDSYPERAPEEPAAAAPSAKPQ